LAARATPFRPKIDDDGDRRLTNFGVERGIRDSNGIFTHGDIS
jgi:hypothetical protein